MRFGAPKEDARFWRELAKVEHFDPARSLFVDDSLPRAACRARGRHGPDLCGAAARQLGGRRAHSRNFPAVDAVAELL